MMILITASLPSNTYNKASWWEELTFEWIKWTLSNSLITFWDCLRIVRGGQQTSRLFFTKSPSSIRFWFVFPRTATIRSQKIKCGYTIQPQSSIQGNDFWFSWTVRNWSFFLHIRLIGTNVWLSQKTHNVPPDVDFESSRSPAKSESWNSPNLHYFTIIPTWQYCLYLHVWM